MSKQPSVDIKITNQKITTGTNMDKPLPNQVRPLTGNLHSFAPPHIIQFPHSVQSGCPRPHQKLRKPDLKLLELFRVWLSNKLSKAVSHLHHFSKS